MCVCVFVCVCVCTCFLSVSTTEIGKLTLVVLFEVILKTLKATLRVFLQFRLTRMTLSGKTFERKTTSDRYFFNEQLVTDFFFFIWDKVMDQKWCFILVSLKIPELWKFSHDKKMENLHIWSHQLWKFVFVQSGQFLIILE